VLFEKLIEQHRVHHLVAHAFHLAFVIAIYQVSVHFFHFLGDQSKSERLDRIKLLSKTEADRLKRVKRMAPRSQGFDVLLVTPRRNNLRMAKSAVAQPDCNVIVNACAKILCLGVHIADIGAVIDTNLAGDSLSNTNIAVPLMPEPAFEPTAVLLSPVLLLTSTLPPTAALPVPVVLLMSALKPTAVLLPPPVLAWSALRPVAVLKPPVTLLKSAREPLAVLKLPVALLKSA
jgi:hypothetical protein